MPSQESSPLTAERQGVVAVIVRDGKFLVVRRSAEVEAPLQLAFPGGAKEITETDEQAVRRELWEELQVDVDPVECIWSSITPWRVSLAWWHCRMPDQASLEPNPAEIAEVLWMTTAELQSHGPTG